jgi:hypothetical protein
MTCNDAVRRVAVVSMKGLNHVRERILLSLLALSFCLNMRMRRHYHRVGLLDTTGPEQRLSTAHHNVDSVIEHIGRWGDNNLEHKQAGRFSSGIRPHYHLW